MHYLCFSLLFCRRPCFQAENLTHGHRTLFRRAAICTLVLGMIFLAGMAGGCRAFAEPAGDTESAVNFNRTLDDYVPQKDRYNFYFTYKIVHPWWDAVAMGIEDAQRQYLDRGISITYEYMAPAKASAEDQKARLQRAAEGGYDVIGVDVADEAVISPVLDSLVESGLKVMVPRLQKNRLCGQHPQL